MSKGLEGTINSVIVLENSIIHEIKCSMFLRKYMINMIKKYNNPKRAVKY